MIYYAICQHEFKTYIQIQIQIQIFIDILAA